MGEHIPLSFSATAVLRAIDQGYRYGFDIMDALDLPSGTVYPALAKLEQAGMVRSRWEDPRVAREEKRPPRKYYQITRSGEEAMEESLQRLRAVDRLEPVPDPPSSPETSTA